MKRRTGRRAWRSAIVICLLLAACRSEEEGALRRYLSEMGYSHAGRPDNDTLVLLPLQSCTACLLEYQELIATDRDRRYIIATANGKKARILFPASSYPNVLIDDQKRAVDEYGLIRNFPRLVFLSGQGSRMAMGEEIHASALREAFGLERVPRRLSAAFVALDTIELTFAEARYNVGGLKKDGPYLFFKSIRFFPSLNLQGAEVTRLHLPSGVQDAIGQPDLGERAFVEGISTYALAAGRLYLLGSTHLFEYALSDRSLVRWVRPQFENELAPGRTSSFFHSNEASGAWLCPVGALNMHAFSPAYFAPSQPVLALLDRDGAMLRGIGRFPEAFRQGTFLHPSSLFVADLAGEELYLLFNSERTLRVYDLQGRELRSVALPASEWMDYELQYLDIDYESDEAMMALSRDAATRAAHANEYYQGLQVTSQRIRLAGTGFANTGDRSREPHNFILDYYPERNAYTDVLIDTGRVSFAARTDSDTLFYLKALAKEKMLIISGRIEVEE